MKKILSFIAASAAALLALSCSEQEIPVYRAEDSTVYFSSASTEFSLKTVTEKETDITINLTLIGPACDYDRPIKIDFPDSSWVDAVAGVDYDLKEALVPAGELSGKIVLHVQNPDDLESKSLAIALVPDENFPHTVASHDYTKVTWSKEYVRPSDILVWQTWYLFFSQGYSRRLHQLLVDQFGVEIETASYKSSAMKRDDLTYHVISWWYSASREFYDMVKAHDEANPDSPYMHSSDYEYYSSYNVAVGEGTKPDTVPTILSTLNSL